MTIGAVVQFLSVSLVLATLALCFRIVASAVVVEFVRKD